MNAGNWVALGALVSMAVAAWLVARRPRRRQGPADTPPTHLDWCDGCDLVKSSNSMAFDVAGLYRCATCRSATEPPEKKEFLEEAQRRNSSGPPRPITGREIELDSVAPGQKVLAEAGGASITVRGDVGEGAEVFARGGCAKVIVGGHIHAHAIVSAQGGSARVTYGTADPTADIRARGGDSKVIATGRKNIIK